MSHFKGSRNRINTPTEEFLSNLKPGEHGCVFCTSKKAMQNIQFAFVKSGLEGNWGVVYASATEPLQQVRDSMQKYGIDTVKHETSCSLIIAKGEDLYKNPQAPDLELWISQAKSISRNFVDKGKKGARIAADLSSFFISMGLEKQWFDLEYTLERRLSLPLSVLCAYNVNIPELLNTDILKYYTKIDKENEKYIDAHSFVIYASTNKSAVFTI